MWRGSEKLTMTKQVPDKTLHDLFCAFFSSQENEPRKRKEKKKNKKKKKTRPQPKCKERWPRSACVSSVKCNQDFHFRPVIYRVQTSFAQKAHYQNRTSVHRDASPYSRTRTYVSVLKGLFAYALSFCPSRLEFRGLVDNLVIILG